MICLSDVLSSLISFLATVTFSYEHSRSDDTSQKPRLALDNVSFTVAAKQKLAIVGATGSGKSTIFSRSKLSSLRLVFAD